MKATKLGYAVPLGYGWLLFHAITAALNQIASLRTRREGIGPDFLKDSTEGLITISMSVPRGYGWLLIHAITAAQVQVTEMQKTESGIGSGFLVDASEGPVTILIEEEKP